MKPGDYVEFNHLWRQNYEFSVPSGWGLQGIDPRPRLSAQPAGGGIILSAFMAGHQYDRSLHVECLTDAGDIITIDSCYLKTLHHGGTDGPEIE